MKFRNHSSKNYSHDVHSFTCFWRKIKNIEPQTNQCPKTPILLFVPYEILNSCSLWALILSSELVSKMHHLTLLYMYFYHVFKIKAALEWHSSITSVEHHMLLPLLQKLNSWYFSRPSQRQLWSTHCLQSTELHLLNCMKISQSCFRAALQGLQQLQRTITVTLWNCHQDPSFYCNVLLLTLL